MTFKLSFVFRLFGIFVICPAINADRRVHMPEKIIGGDLTERQEIKYAVSIHLNGTQICTGGILAERHVLAAAHCFIDGRTKEIRRGRSTIIANTNDLNDKTQGIEIGVEKVYVPIVQNGTYWSNQIPLGDIAVLELKTPLNLTLNEDLEPLNLPEAETHPNPQQYNGVIAQVVGYGWYNITVWYDNGSSHAKGSIDGKLRKANTQVVPYYRCLRPTQSKRVGDILCAKVISRKDGGHQGACAGDSGAPLVDKDNVVIGVHIESSFDCNDNNTPGTYTKVSKYVKFIKNAINKKDDGTYEEILLED